MHIFHTISHLQNFLYTARQAGKTIGFVPTMGALHEGHLSLIRTAKQHTDIVVCSIFVNPTQFNNAHDLAVYPRTLEADCAMLAGENCEAVFAPSAEEMYPNMPYLSINFGELEQVLEGKFRPGHFNGVGIVVAKLFNIVQPNHAFFGQKDLQQCLIIRRLVNDLSFSLQLHICPTLREADGLAMSSRNRNLTPEQRATAPKIYEALCTAKEQLNNLSPQAVKANLVTFLAQQEGIILEYFEIADTQTLKPIEEIKGKEVALCIAAFMGKTRLIDNLLLTF